MLNILIQLINDRHVFVPKQSIQSFCSFAGALGVIIHGGVMFVENDKCCPLKEACQCFYLDGPMTEAEGRIFAKQKGFLSDYERMIANGSEPFRAIEEYYPSH